MSEPLKWYHWFILILILCIFFLWLWSSMLGRCQTIRENQIVVGPIYVHRMPSPPALSREVDSQLCKSKQPKQAKSASEKNKLVRCCQPGHFHVSKITKSEDCQNGEAIQANKKVICPVHLLNRKETIEDFFQERLNRCYKL
uniref:Uncharacterized protein n=1 Tax=Strigamia maritima TaxID=126957 RepID=T1JER5_STRMM